MKRIVLFVGISLFLYSSMVFASSSIDLWGGWELVSYVCQLPNGSFKEITNEKELESINAFIFNNKDNQYVNVTFNYDDACEILTSGTYSVDGTYLSMNAETRSTIAYSDGVINFIFGSIPCTVSNVFTWVNSLIDETESVTNSKFFIKNNYLYLEDYESDDSLSQQCADGIVFQKLHSVQKDTI